MAPSSLWKRVRMMPFLHLLCLSITRLIGFALTLPFALPRIDCTVDCRCLWKLCVGNPGYMLWRFLSKRTQMKWKSCFPSSVLWRSSWCVEDQTFDRPSRIGSGQNRGMVDTGAYWADWIRCLVHLSPKSLDILLSNIYELSRFYKFPCVNPLSPVGTRVRSILKHPSQELSSSRKFFLIRLQTHLYSKQRNAINDSLNWENALGETSVKGKRNRSKLFRLDLWWTINLGEEAIVLAWKTITTRRRWMFCSLPVER